MGRRPKATQAAIEITETLPQRQEVALMSEFVEAPIANVIAFLVQFWLHAARHAYPVDDETQDAEVIVLFGGQASVGDAVLIGARARVVAMSLGYDESYLTALESVAWLHTHPAGLIVPDLLRHCQSHPDAKRTAARLLRRLDTKRTLTALRERWDEDKQQSAATIEAAERDRPPTKPPDRLTVEKVPIAVQNGTNNVPKSYRNRPALPGTREAQGIKKSIPQGTQGAGKRNAEFPLKRIHRTEDLRDPRLLVEVFAEVNRSAPINGLSDSEADLLFFVAASVRALSEGKRPVALFKHLVLNVRRDLISHPQEQRANQLLKSLIVVSGFPPTRE